MQSRLSSFVARGTVSAERGAEAPFGDESFRIRPALRGTDFFAGTCFRGQDTGQSDASGVLPQKTSGLKGTVRSGMHGQ